MKKGSVTMVSKEEFKCLTTIRYGIEYKPKASIMKTMKTVYEAIAIALHRFIFFWWGDML